MNSFKQQLEEKTKKVRQNIPEIENLRPFLTLAVDPLADLDIEEIISTKNADDISELISVMCERILNYLQNEDIINAFKETIINQPETDREEQKATLRELAIIPVQINTKIPLILRDQLKMLNDKTTMDNGEEVTKPGLVSRDMVTDRARTSVQEALKSTNQLTLSINEAKRAKELREHKLAETTLNEIFDDEEIKKLFDGIEIYREQPLGSGNQKKRRLKLKKPLKPELLKRSKNP